MTRPSASVGTTPKARGSPTSVRCRVTAASASRCRRTNATMSRPDRMSPLKMTTGSPGPPRSRDATLRIAPPVPSGSVSVTYSSSRPCAEPSPKYSSNTSARYEVARTTRVMPASRARASMWAVTGTPATASIGFGADIVSGRSRLPCPPTSITASMTRECPRGRTAWCTMSAYLRGVASRTPADQAGHSCRIRLVHRPCSPTSFTGPGTPECAHEPNWRC